MTMENNIIMVPDQRKWLYDWLVKEIEKQPFTLDNDLVYEYLCRVFNPNGMNDHLGFVINKELISIEHNALAKILRYNNLYVFVLCCGIYVPYYDWIYNDYFQYKNKIYYYDSKAAAYGIRDYVPSNTMEDGNQYVIPM